MMKSPFMRMLFVLSAWLCTIAALHSGIVALMGGRSFVQDFFFRMGMPWLYMPVLMYVFGIAGIICLIYLIMDAMQPGSLIKS